MTVRRKIGSQLLQILGVVFSIAAVVYLVRSVEKEEVFHHVRNVDALNLFWAFLVVFVSYFIRGARWPLFFESHAPRYWDSFRCLILGFFMNNVLPARIGELVRAHLGGKATNQSRAIVLATIAGERLADGLMISILFVLLFTAGASASEVAYGKEVYYVSYLFAIVSLATTIVLYKRSAVFHFLERLNQIFPGHLSSYTLVRARHFIEGLGPMLQPKRLVVISLLSLSIWLIELFAYYQVSLAFGQDLSVAVLCLFLAVVNFSSLIPSAPGGMGVIELFATGALTLLGVDRESALAMVGTQHLLQYVVVGLPGIYYFLRMKGRLPKPEDVGEVDSDYIESAFTDVSLAKPGAVIDSESPKSGEVQSLLPIAIDLEKLAKLAPETEIVYSVVIPAYNEENRLPKTLLSVLEYFQVKNAAFEILVVDDGSKDRTAQIVRQFERLSPQVRLLICPRNRGKGYAVRLGAMNARGALILVNDADGATPIEELDRLENAIQAGAQVAIGSRAMFSKETQVQTLWYRKFIGRVFNGMVNFIILPGIADTQCGFKLFIRPVARYIFSQQRADRFSFDVELLFLARKAGCKIAEVPVNWTNVAGSKVNLVRDSAHMLFDVICFRLRDTFGGYQGAEGVLPKAETL